MNKTQEALKLALEALAACDDFLFNYHDCEPNNEREVDAYSEVRGNNMKAWEAVREALAHAPTEREQPAPVAEPHKQQEPWPEEPEGHVAGGVQPSKLTQARWTERWYGSLAEKGWWICCGREHIAHLGTELSSEEVRKIVDAHNLHNPVAQQQEPVAWVCEGSSSDEKHAIDYWPGDIEDIPIGTKLYTSPQPSKPWVGLTDEQIQAIAFEAVKDNWDWLKFARAIEAKLREKNA